MSDHYGCHCGHPHAEPDWIDHEYGCPYLGDIDNANTMIAHMRNMLGVRFDKPTNTVAANALRASLVELFAQARRTHDALG